MCLMEGENTQTKPGGTGEIWQQASDFYFSRATFSMLLFYHTLLGAFLLFFLLSGHWVSAKNINFYNVRPPLDPTPFPNSFKCFTCDNAVDNYNCNRWAEDRWCPESTQYCLTVHLFTDHGKSTSVTKKCATGDECHFVGCHHHRESGHTECVSCCEGMICNVEIPTNHTNAVFAVLHARRTSDGSRRTVSIAVLVSVMAIALS
uniref:LY6/PLAUR domain containing 6B n=2 Tax=Phasianinae TaxID=9072 RepID=A0A8C3M1A9_CHRPC